MSYTKQNFIDDDVLYAYQLNAMEDGIVAVYNAINKMQPNGSASGLSTEAVSLLEIILNKAVYSADQTNNITALISMLKVGSNGSEDNSGGDNSGVVHAVTLNLDGVTPSNMNTSVTSGGVYINRLEPTVDGYVLGSVTITMGGYDVTSKYYDGEGNITITSVTGDIVITCKALAVEKLTIVSAGSAPDKTTFAYTEVASFSQPQVVAKESVTKGGTLNVAWDAGVITGGPSIFVYLFKDGAPYKVASNVTGSDVVETSDGVSTAAFWQDPGSYALAMATTKPFSIMIPDGCTVMACLRRNGMANDTVTSNATWSAWVGAGNLTVTVTEGE